MGLKPAASRLSLLLGLLFSAAPTFSADLMQVYRAAQSNDQLYAAARATAEAGREKGPQGLSGLLPTIGATANTVWNLRFSTDNGASWFWVGQSNGQDANLSFSKNGHYSF